MPSRAPSAAWRRSRGRCAAIACVCRRCLAPSWIRCRLVVRRVRGRRRDSWLFRPRRTPPVFLISTSVMRRHGSCVRLGSRTCLAPVRRCPVMARRRRPLLHVSHLATGPQVARSTWMWTRSGCRRTAGRACVFSQTTSVTRKSWDATHSKSLRGSSAMHTCRTVRTPYATAGTSLASGPASLATAAP